MKTKTVDSPALKSARERYTSASQRVSEAAAAVEELAADATQEDRDAAGAAFDQALEQADAAKSDVERLDRIAASRAAHQVPDAADADADDGTKRDKVTIGREPLTYEQHDVKTSYLLDLARMRFKIGDTEGARDRLTHHRSEIQVEVTRREKQHQQVFSRDFEALIDSEVRQGLVNPMIAEMVMRSYQQRAVSRLDGSGGEFVPPLWALDLYAPAVRAGRPFADRVRGLPLPGGTDSINIPIITVGGLTGFQTQDNQAITSQDWQLSSVLAPVRTVAGQLDVAMQLLEQSPIAFDQIAFGDLAADQALQLDTGLISGNGGPGQLLGILNVAGIGSTTYTDGTPTAPEIYPKLAGALNAVAKNRKRLATAMWMHSQRYYWLASQLDGNNRPFLPPVGGAGVQAVNAFGALDPAAQGSTDTALLGVPVMVDQSIPVNLGGGTNEDRVIATVMDDHILFEGDIRTRVLEEVLRNTLGVRFQLYNYVAFTAGRFPSGTSVVSGTGLATPSF